MLSLLILVSVSQPVVDSPPPAPVLTIEHAVATAQKHHPKLRAAAAQSAGADAKADQARAALRPTLDASGRTSTSANGPFGDGSIHGRTSYNFGLSGGMLIYDFGRTQARVDASQLSAAAQKHDQRAVELDVIRDARMAFLSARAAKELVVVARENLANQQRHLDQVQAFVKVGARPKIDLAKSQTQVANAQAALARAENDYAAAKAQLNAAMGLTGSTNYEIANAELGAVEGESSSTKVLYDEAMASRPELAAAKADIKAQKLSLEATKKNLHPAVRFGTDVSAGGSDLGQPGWNVSAGISVSFTLFDGGANNAKVRAEKASLVSLEAQKDALDQQTWLSVEQARLGVRSAKAELLAAIQGHAAAKELLTLAQGRYQQGAGNAVEIADAQLELTNAAARKIAASLKLETARAQLLRTLGRTTWA